MEKFMPGWQFKNLTTDSKIFYSSMIFILFWFMLIILNSCSSSIYKIRKDHIKFTHVLAVTEMGDTLQIPIEEIKPNIIYNIVGYVNRFSGYMGYDPYYSIYNNRYYYDYYPYNYNYNNVIYYNTKSTWKPPVVISAPNINSKSSSGFSGKPVASNPVIISGGTKKKN